MNLSPAWAVFRFEWRRTATLPRMAWWLALALFPAAILLLIRTTGARLDPITAAIVLLALVPGVVCMMTTLLYATPIVHAEIEGRSWIYLAVRPHGKLSMLLGKYLAGAVWTTLAGWIAAVLAVLVAQPEETGRVLAVLLVLVVLAALAYGALFSFIGILMPSRAMVLTVAYALMLELLVGFIPAMINQFTVQFRLRSLMFQWLELQPREEAVRLLIGSASPLQHLAILAVFTLILLTAAALLLHAREFAVADD